MIRLQKLDFDALYDEAEREKRFGVCPICEFAGDSTEHVLCWCGVCLSRCHNDYFHEDPLPDYPPECFGQEVTS